MKYWILFFLALYAAAFAVNWKYRDVVDPRVSWAINKPVVVLIQLPYIKLAGFGVGVAVLALCIFAASRLLLFLFFKRGVS